MFYPYPMIFFSSAEVRQQNIHLLLLLQALCHSLEPIVAC